MGRRYYCPHNASDLEHRLLEKDPEAILISPQLDKNKLRSRGQDPKDYWGSISNVLAQHQLNQHIQGILIVHYFRENTLLLDSWENRLFGTIGHLNNLQTVIIEETEIPMDCLISILNTSNRIRCLHLRYTTIFYKNEEEYQSLIDAIERRQTVLTHVTIEDCKWQPMPEGHSSTSHIDNAMSSQVLHSISQIPALQNVDCSLLKKESSVEQIARNVGNQLQPGTLQRLGQAPALTTLRLFDIWLSEDDVVCLCRALLQRSSKRNAASPLRQLRIECDLGSVAATSLSTLLTDSQCVLERLALHVLHMEDPDSPIILAQALAQQPRKQGLKSFSLAGHPVRDLSIRSKVAFAEMVRTNASLEYVYLGCQDYALRKQLGFYLELNQHGRRELFASISVSEQADTPLWTSVLCRNQGNMRALHYFVSLNPGYFATAALTALDRWEKEQEPPEVRQQRLELEAGIIYDTDGW